MTEAIQVFVGSAPHGLDAESDLVLEYSLRKHCSAPVDIHWMRTGTDMLWKEWEQSQWATPFSGFRWAVPAANQFRGRAIYLDNDIVILAGHCRVAECGHAGPTIHGTLAGPVLCLGVRLRQGKGSVAVPTCYQE